MTGLNHPSVSYDYTEVEEAFPEVDPGVNPFGYRVLVQIRSAMEVTKGGIIVPNESRETEIWNTQVAKVIKIGPVAFKNRDTLDLWPEGQWVQPGMFVRVPLYGGDRWNVPVPDSKGKALFVLFKDTDMIGEITGNPLDVVAFI